MPLTLVRPKLDGTIVATLMNAKTAMGAPKSIPPRAAMKRSRMSKATGLDGPATGSFPGSHCDSQSTKAIELRALCRRTLRGGFLVNRGCSDPMAEIDHNSFR